MLVLIAGRRRRGRAEPPQVYQAGTINGSPIRVGHASDRHRRQLERAPGHDSRAGSGSPARRTPARGPSAIQRQLYQSNYTIQSGDVGRYIALNLYAYTRPTTESRDRGRAERSTVTSSTVAPARRRRRPCRRRSRRRVPTATPTPTPTRRRRCPRRPRVRGPGPTPVPTSGEVLQETSRHRRVIRPFPVVRMRGTLTDKGAKISLFSVRAPRTAMITVRCKGRAARRAAGRARTRSARAR